MLRVRSVILLFAAASAAFGQAPAPSAPPAAPRRIVSIAPNSDEILCALGACDLVVACSKFTVYPPELKDRPRVGGLYDPNLERIAALRPDLVVLRGDNDKVAQLCRDLNVRLYRDRTDRLADIETTIRELGAIVERREQAEKLAADFRTKLDAVRARVAGRPRPRVLVIISRQPTEFSNLLTAGAGNFLSEMIDIAGGENVFGHVQMMYPKVSPESILTSRPDVILELLPEAGALADAQRKAMIAQWAGVGAMPAVQSGRIHFLTEDNALTPSPRFVEIVDHVSRLLHPEPARAP